MTRMEEMRFGVGGVTFVFPGLSTSVFGLGGLGFFGGVVFGTEGFGVFFWTFEEVLPLRVAIVFDLVEIKVSFSGWPVTVIV